MALAISHTTPLVVEYGHVGRQQHRQFRQSGSSGFSSGMRSQRRTRSYPSAPTNPPVSGGNPGMRGVASTCNASARRSCGGPAARKPVGSWPNQRPSPSVSVSNAALRTPMKLYRVHLPPCSADSSRKVPGRSAASDR